MNTSSGSAVFRKGMVEEICDVCTTCTPGESDDDHITKCNSDLGPGSHSAPDSFSRLLELFVFVLLLYL